MVFKTKNIVCTGNPKYVDNVTCSVKARNWNNAVAYMDCDLVLPLQNTTFHLEFFKKGYNNRYHPFLVNVMIKMCDVMTNRNFLPYGTIAKKIFKEYTNVNHSCPFTGHLLARNISFHESYLPNLPLGIYLLTFDVLENFDNGTTESAGFVKFYFEAMEKIKPKRKQKNSTINFKL
ncbi:uncharacterized protein LOC133846517 [Drosophila sulfurigaster albostrigata]|uniref:uncharacterized protein LOC133846517 n=1 Tax=Drosophila sulfurigaster albostrigata TaxID=89887 RepID=UPI002D2195F4|nr:uncharacterized protein LOC133846517 [Drosophila sulfurigaster albostrigata]